MNNFKGLTLKEAAEDAAGNWKKWECFFFSGERKFANSHDLYLFYTKTFESGLKDEANHVTITRVLKPYLGMQDDPTKTVEYMNNSFCGDQDALQGYIVRVYNEDGEITDAFKALYELMKDYNPDCSEWAINEKDFEATNDKLLKQLVVGEVRSLAQRVLDGFREDGVSWDDVSADEVLKELRKLLRPVRHRS
jgi:hypothetical protein